MKTLLLIFIGGLVGWFITYEGPTDYNPTPNSLRTDTVVSFDWENNREITKAMADSMTLTGGHWYSNKELKKLKKTHKSKREPKWIRPAGKDRVIRESKAAERQWRLNQEKEQPLTEDDVRDIIRTEYER